MVISKELVIAVVSAELLLAAVAITLLVGHGVIHRLLGDEKRLEAARKVLITQLSQDQKLGYPPGLPQRVWLELIGRLAPNFKGEYRQALFELATEVGLIKHAERSCCSRRWSKRLKGARVLVLIGGSQSVMEKLLNDSHQEVRAQATEWVAEHPSEKNIARLFEMLTEQDVLCQYSAQDALLRIGMPVVPQLADFLVVNTGRPVQLALRIAASLIDPRLLSVAINLCHDHEPKTRALAAAVVAAHGGEAPVKALQSLLSDSDETVRAQAAKGIGKLEYWPAAPELAKLMDDSAWQVRHAAALSLASSGSSGQLFLRKALRSENKQASALAKQVLELPNYGVAK